jgi:hypothetical protein
MSLTSEHGAIAKAWTFDSSSGTAKYQTLQYSDGYVSCDCRGWINRCAPDGTRSCKHTRMVDMGNANTIYDDAPAPLAKATKTWAAEPGEYKVKAKPVEITGTIARKIEW